MTAQLELRGLDKSKDFMLDFPVKDEVHAGVPSTRGWCVHDQPSAVDTSIADYDDLERTTVQSGHVHIHSHNGINVIRHQHLLSSVAVIT